LNHERLPIDLCASSVSFNTHSSAYFRFCDAAQAGFAQPFLSAVVPMVRGENMRTLKYFGLMTFAASLLFTASNQAPAQVAVEIGAPPVCPYGYYEVPPYNCAPDGYYGPEWFSGGVFIGAGPWFHGPEHFYGHVDHHYDYRKGYHGPYPERGARPSDHRSEFHGQAMHDAHGHEAPHGHH
jgi:hypothetical protein